MIRDKMHGCHVKVIVAFKRHMTALPYFGVADNSLGIKRGEALISAPPPSDTNTRHHVITNSDKLEHYGRTSTVV